jgi:hypothetical protein
MMRRLVIALLGAWAAVPVLAGEFELKPETIAPWIARDAAAAVARLEPLDAAPPGAEGPAGPLAWGRLVAGEKTYFVCFQDIEPFRKYNSRELQELPKKGKAYLDRDGDGDFAEETPVEGFVSCETMPGTEFLRFVFEDLPARFKIGGSPLDLNVRLGYTVPGRVALFTVFAGRDPSFPEGVVGFWTPGAAKPDLMLRGSGLWIHECFIGPRKLVILEDGLKSKGGKLVLTFREQEGCELVPVALPESCRFILSTPQAGPLPSTPCKPEGGKVFLRPHVQCVVGQFARTLGGDEWVLQTARPELRVEPGTSFGDIEPLTYYTRIQETAGGTEFWAWFEDASGQSCGLRKNGGLAGPPLMTVKDEEGREVFSHRFEVDRSGTLKVRLWKVPAELSGKVLRAELDVEKSPFRILTPHQTFIP